MNRRKPEIFPMTPTKPIWDAVALVSLAIGIVVAFLGFRFFESTSISAASVFAGFLVYVVIKSIRATPGLRPVYICVVMPLGLAIALAILPLGSPFPAVICFATAVLAGLWFLVLKYPPQYRAASKAFRAGNLLEAVSLLDQAIRTQPNSGEAYQLRSVAHTILYQAAAGERDARKAIELDPDEQTCHCALGMALLSQQRYAQAEDAFQRALELGPQFALNHYNKGLACYYLEDFGTAIQCIRFALGNALPDQFHLMGNYYLGSSLLKTGDPVAARAAFKRLRKYRSAYEEFSAGVQEAPDYPMVMITRRELEDIESYLN